MGRQLTVERRNEIATLLLRDGNLKVSDLAKQFGVSTETIRKDLIYLDKQGIAQKSYGGAIATGKYGSEVSYCRKSIRTDSTKWCDPFGCGKYKLCIGQATYSQK